MALLHSKKKLYLDEMRSRQRVADVSEINDLPSNENVENSVADSDMAFRIHLVLHRLEEPYKEVFQLRVFGELSFSQIAAIFEKQNHGRELLIIVQS